MSKREECRKCGAKLRHDKTSDQYDPEYCSGKCRKEDGAEPYVKTVEEQAMVVEVVKKKNPASLEDYKKNVPSKYARRFEPEKLNWSKHKMNEEELKQAGFRANREPIPGDWDYEVPSDEPSKEQQYPLGSRRINGNGQPEVYGRKVAAKPPTEWEQMKAKAKALNIKIFGKNKEQLAAEIKEAENA